MDNSSVAMIAPAIVNRTVRRPNAQLRTREHLTLNEVERLIEIASANRQGQRDGLMVLLAFRHGLRAAEVCDLRWEQIDFNAATLHVRRIKHGTPATHPLAGAIAELARLGLTREFRMFDPANARIVLVQAADRVLPTFPSSLSAAAKLSAALQTPAGSARGGCREGALGGKPRTIRRGDDPRA
jgi:integrase